MTKKSNITNLSSIKNARPKPPSVFEAVFKMEDDIRAVLDCTNVLVDALHRDDEIPSEVAQGLGRVSWDARKAGDRLKGQFEAALELARQEKRA